MQDANILLREIGFAGFSIITTFLLVLKSVHSLHDETHMLMCLWKIQTSLIFVLPLRIVFQNFFFEILQRPAFLECHGSDVLLHHCTDTNIDIQFFHYITKKHNSDSMFFVLIIEKI